VSDNIENIIRKNLGEKSLQKIEDRLLERYSISLDQCLWEYEKFDSVLREFFGDGAIGLERKIFKSLDKLTE
jgi:hypothetical protein